MLYSQRANEAAPKTETSATIVLKRSQAMVDMSTDVTNSLNLEDRQPGMRCCNGLEYDHLNDGEAQHLSDDLSILAHPIRLQILDMLARHPGQVCVCDLEAALPVKQPTISHHLKLLRAAGLIDCERHGLWAYYFVQRDAMRALYTRVNGQLQAFAD